LGLHPQSIFSRQRKDAEETFC